MTLSNIDLAPPTSIISRNSRLNIPALQIDNSCGAVHCGIYSTESTITVSNGTISNLDDKYFRNTSRFANFPNINIITFSNFTVENISCKYCNEPFLSFQASTFSLSNSTFYNISGNNSAVI